MAEKILNTRIQLKYDSLQNWAAANTPLKQGEVAIAYLPPRGNGVAPDAVSEAVLMKVGPGNFNDLPFMSALAADVYEWAKQHEVKIAGAGNAVTNVTIEAAADGKEYLTFNKGTTFATKAELDAALEAFGGDIAAITDNDHQYSFEIVGGKLEVKTTNYVNGKAGDTTSVASLDFITPDELNTILTTDYYTKIELTDKIHTTAEIKAMEIAHATAAGKVDNALTVKVGGSDVVFDGSAAKTADVDAAITAAINAIPEVVHPEYSIVKDATSEYAAAYHLTKDGVNVGAAINIPKDLVVESGKVETLEAGVWGEAGTYIILTLANATNDKIYVNVGSLIEYVTSGSTADSQVIVAIDEQHKVTATIGAGKVTATEIADGAVTNAKLADNSVNTDEIMDGAITIAKFAGDVDAKFEEINTGINNNTAAINVINDEATGILAQAKKDSSDKVAVALAESQKYADGLAGNYATAAQGAKADSALQSVEVGTGLKVSAKADNKQTIDLDESVIFILNCGSATEVI